MSEQLLRAGTPAGGSLRGTYPDPRVVLRRFRAQRSATEQSFSANTFTKVIFDVVDFEYLSGVGDYAEGTGRFTASSGGVLLLGAWVLISKPGGARLGQLAVYKNGVLVPSLLDERRMDTIASSLGGSVPVALQAGDYVEVFVFLSGESERVQPGSCLWGVWLGE